MEDAAKIHKIQGLRSDGLLQACTPKLNLGIAASGRGMDLSLFLSFLSWVLMLGGREILLKDTLKMFNSTLVPCFNASTVYYIDNIQNIVAFVGISGMLKSACKIFKVPPLISWPVSLSLD